MWIDDMLTDTRGWCVWDTNEGIWWAFSWIRSSFTNSISFIASTRLRTSEQTSYLFANYGVDTRYSVMKHRWWDLTPAEAENLWQRIHDNPIVVVMLVALR